MVDCSERRTCSPTKSWIGDIWERLDGVWWDILRIKNPSPECQELGEPWDYSLDQSKRRLFLSDTARTGYCLDERQTREE